MRKIILGVSLATFAGVGYSQATPLASAAPQVPMAICPHIPEIKKNPVEGNWTATTTYGFWKSYHRTFSNTLTHFDGAQWVGANLGQITCIYSTEQQFMMNGQLNVQKTFPLMLVYHALAYQPTGPNWKHVKHGVYNCVSHNQDDCAFAMNIEQGTGNIFEEAESLKSQQTNSVSPLNAE